MKRILFIILGILSLGAGVFMLITGLDTIISGSGFNDSLTDSVNDKIFFLLMAGGYGLCYLWASLLLFNRKLIKNIVIQYAGLASGYAAMIGILYMTFGSPW